MKKILSLFLVHIFALFFLSACEDLLDVRETFTFSLQFPVSTNHTSFSSSDVVDLAAQSELVERYGSKIKDIQLTRLEVRLAAFTGSQTQYIQGGLLSVAETNGDDMKLIASMGGQYLHELRSQSVEIPIDSDGANKFGTLAKNAPHRFLIMYDANVNEGPLNFTLVFDFTAVMVANPLN